MGSAEGGHPDLCRFPRFLPICFDLRSLFLGIRRFVPICSVFFDLFRFVFRTNQSKSGKPLSADPFCKSPTLVLQIADCFTTLNVNNKLFDKDRERREEEGKGAILSMATPADPRGEKVL